MKKIRVAINGYGKIGRRVSHAVQRQDDMELVGVTKTKQDFKFSEAIEKGIKVFQSAEHKITDNSSFEGTLHDLLRISDVVIDAAPKNCGKENLKIYAKFKKLKVIFQGGESHSLTNFSFNSHVNYDDAKNKKLVRVLSCNSTALCRVINQLNNSYSIKKVRAAIVRRSADPGDNNKGSVDCWEPTLSYPSHHAADVRTILKNTNISSLAGIASMTLMHGQMIFVEFKESPANINSITANLSSNSRISIVSSDNGFKSTAQLKDFAQAKSLYANIYEACIWKEGLKLDQDGELGIQLTLDQQAIVVPENIDAIRAMFGLMPRDASIEKTDLSLGILGVSVVS